MPYQSGWWQSFYSGHYVDFHRQVVSKKPTAHEVDFMLELFQLPAGAEVLDLGCGEGRHAIEMAKRGYRVTAIDVTERLLDIARANAASQQVDIQFVQQDMRDLPWEDSFDAAYCVWGSFGVFDDQGHYDLLKSTYHALKAGGRLIIENHCLETMLPNFPTVNRWQRLGDSLLHLEEQHFDHTTSRLESNWIFVDQATGQIERDALSLRIYSYLELCRLLESAGFHQFTSYDTISGQPFALGARRLTLLSSKP